MSKGKVITVAIVPAAGSGSRMGGAVKKQFLALGGTPILARTLLRIAESSMVNEIILVAPVDDIIDCKQDIVEKHDITKVKSIVPGGLTRSESVSNGFESLPAYADFVLTHDGARPFATVAMIEEVITLAQAHGASTAAIMVKDTLKQVEGGLIIGGVGREGVARIQTPQCFQRDVLQAGLDRAREDAYIPTDESSLIERLGLPVAIARGSERNIKITTEEDLNIAEMFLGME